jgi:hypothetical protein
VLVVPERERVYSERQSHIVWSGLSPWRKRRVMTGVSRRPGTVTYSPTALRAASRGVTAADDCAAPLFESQARDLRTGSTRLAVVVRLTKQRSEPRRAGRSAAGAQ